VDYDDFITTVEEGAHVSSQEAQRAACATLQTLADRLTAGETQDIAERVPPELQPCLVTAGGAEPFHVDEFTRRLADRLGVDRSRAEQEAKAVFTALWRTVGPDEFADMRSELPKDFDPLIDEALAEEPPPYVAGPSPTPALPFDEFVTSVADRARVDRQRAQRATEAVLEVLATRITGGQVADLEVLLPAELRPPLERGRTRTGGRARPLSLTAFLREVAELEGVDRGQAAEHARAVFATLREAVGDKEFSDTTAQLPGEYRTLLARG
jgi:uncharacterized protein (DUF2267 family)